MMLFRVRPLWLLLSLATLGGLSGCAVGPAYVAPAPEAPADWQSWRSADAALQAGVAMGPAALLPALPALPAAAGLAPAQLAELEALARQALAASPDLQTATLRFAQARTQRGVTATEAGPQVQASTAATRQRGSETASRPFESAVQALSRSTPSTLFQAGFDVSWELDLWGRVARSLEQADAQVAQQAALLELARQSLLHDLARAYLEYRTTEQLLQGLEKDTAVLAQRLALLEAQVAAGTLSALELEPARAELAGLQAQHPGLLAQAAASLNQMALLLGERPGALKLAPAVAPTAGLPASGGPRPSRGLSHVPDLQLGLPSQVALRRPDIRAAEARLQRATAGIGVAMASLYPSVRLGARAALESTSASDWAGWDSRSWSLGPSIDVPLFDRGRRQGVVQLRELEQQEAAVHYQQTVLRAWQEIDDALNAYAAAQQQVQQREAQWFSATRSLALAQARQRHGLTTALPVLDAERRLLAARQSLTTAQGQRALHYVAVYKATGQALFGP